MPDIYFLLFNNCIAEGIELMENVYTGPARLVDWSKPVELLIEEPKAPLPAIDRNPPSRLRQGFDAATSDHMWDMVVLAARSSRYGE